MNFSIRIGLWFLGGIDDYYFFLLSWHKIISNLTLLLFLFFDYFIVFIHRVCVVANEMKSAKKKTIYLCRLAPSQEFQI